MLEFMMLCYRHPIIQRLYASPILDFTLPAIPTPAKLAQPVFHPILSKNLKVFFPRKCLNCELKARSVSRVNASLGLKFIHFWQKRALQSSPLRHISTSITTTTITTTTTTTTAKSSASSYSLTNPLHGAERLVSSACDGYPTLRQDSFW
jgi:hypothetical protein